MSFFDKFIRTSGEHFARESVTFEYYRNEVCCCLLAISFALVAEYLDEGALRLASQLLNITLLFWQFLSRPSDIKLH